MREEYEQAIADMGDKLYVSRYWETGYIVMTLDYYNKLSSTQKKIFMGVKKSKRKTKKQVAFS